MTSAWIWPNSIRLRTALILSVLVTVLWLAAAGVTARILSYEMGKVFDAALQETGQRVLQLAVVEVLGRDEDGNSQLITALDSAPCVFYLYRAR
jgi:two-component system, OmpR family, sensor kinase